MHTDAPSACPCLVLKPEAWPAGDLKLWLIGLSSHNDLYGSWYAGTLSAITIRNAARAHGRWLSVFGAAGDLDPAAAPGARVTPQRVQFFVDQLTAAGNCDNTIATRLWDLRTALMIMQPQLDFAWITAPGGTDLRALLRIAPKRKPVRSSAELFEWGLRLARDAREQSDPVVRAVRFRNGLMVALLAMRVPRQRAVTALDADMRVTKVGDRYRVLNIESDMKGGRRIDLPAPKRLTPWIDEYLDVHRPVLLGGRQHNAFWVGQDGNPLKQRGIEGVIRRATMREFGRAFGTHWFRHCFGTSAPLAAPHLRAAPAAVMGNSPAVAEKSYNQGNLTIVAEMYHEVLDLEYQDALQYIHK